MEEIQQRLASPECKNNSLSLIVDALKNDIFAQTVADDTPKNFFKTREVYDIIRRQFFGLKKEYERTLDRKSDLQRQIISPQRALAMAKNIFVHDDFKRLREDMRRYKKDEQLLAQKLLDFNQRENIFRSRDWTADNENISSPKKKPCSKWKKLVLPI